MNRANRPSFSRISGSSYASNLLGRAGDGSTLTLDFTTGVLDPRLTFTRTSDATFINSSGLVQYADANLVLNSTMLVSTAWAQSLSGGGTATINGNNTVTFASTAGRATWLQTLGLLSGLPVTFSIEVTALTNTNIRTSDLFAAGFGFGSQVYNYTDTAGNTQTNIGAFATLPGVGLYTITAVTTGTSNNIVFGTDCNGVGRTGTVTIARPQVQYGHVVPRRTYVPNSSTTAANNNTPRFDYDPTTLAPRGLAIEGQAVNLFNWSETFDTTGGANNWNWSVNVTRGTVTTTNPTGASATVIKIEETTTNGLHAPLTTVTVLASTNYTFSVWAKAVERTFVQLLENGGSGANSMVNLSTGAIVSESTAGITTVTALGTTGWYRISMRLTTIVGQTIANCQFRLSTNGTTTSYAGTTGSGIYIWGGQLETGSASSYIPTGASQVTRTADFCYQDGISSWFTSQSSLTMLVDATPRVQTSFPILWVLTDAGGGNSYQLYYTSSGTTNSYTTKVVVGSVGTSESTLASSVQQDTRQIIGYAIASGVGVRSRNGVSGTAAVASSLPTTALTRLAVGSSGSGLPANAHIRRIKYWPYALTQDQLNGATTP